MKKLLFFIFILSSVGFVFCGLASGQTTQLIPLTQSEYVKMLYAVEANPATKDDLIEAIRKRGIDFELTSGLRSLTRSKSRNDSELRRTLEEANRRRENPKNAVLPDRKEAFELLELARQNTLASLEEMPDFVVKQRIKRSTAFAGTNNFRDRDRLVVAVSYRANGQEEYKVLSVNGVRQQNPDSKKDYSAVQGTTSTGEFVSVLATVFKRESETKFELIDTDLIRTSPTLVFDYSIEKDRAQQVISFMNYVRDSTITGVKGRIWVDRKTARVLRLENIATEIPSTFLVRSASRLIEYDWVSINDERFLLPLSSDVRLTFRNGLNILETKNFISFNNYQKYGSEVIVLDDDDEEMPVEDTKKDDDSKTGLPPKLRAPPKPSN